MRMNTKTLFTVGTLAIGLMLIGALAGAQPAPGAPGVPVSTTPVLTTPAAAPGAPPAAPPVAPTAPAPAAAKRANRGAAATTDAQRLKQLLALMQGAAAAPALAVTDKHVFVVFGGTLYQFSIDGLQLIASAPLNLGAGRPGGALNPGRGAGGPIITPGPPAPGAAAPQ